MVGRLNVNKAVGIGGVPGPIIKLIFMYRAQYVLAMFNSIYEIGRLPTKWKVVRLILLSKPGKDPRITSSYQPISILPAIGNVWKNTIKLAIEKKLDLDPFHRDQFGFCKRKGTVDGILQVSKSARYR